jgi:hypothetical protein
MKKAAFATGLLIIMFISSCLVVPHHRYYHRFHHHYAHHVY